MRFTFQAEEFIVEEITVNGTVLEVDKKFEKVEPTPTDGRNQFTWFILQKTNWNTQQALDALAQKIHVPAKRFNVAGTKDRNATTTQLCSAFGIAPQRLLGAHVKDMSINGAWPAAEKLRFGQLLGNRFRIKATKENCGFDAAKFAGIQKLCERGEAINYFGPQRFGSLRANTHLVGYLLLRGNLEGAVRNYLCFLEPQQENESDAKKAEREARERLQKKGDLVAALDYYPKWLKYENAMLQHLAQKPNDFAGALRKLPRSLQLMFIHAAQADIFNKALEARVADGKLHEPMAGDEYWPNDPNGFPDEDKAIAVDDGNAKEIAQKIAANEGVLCGAMIGSESAAVDSYTQEEMRCNGIEQATFNIAALPELTSKGGHRPLFVRAKIQATLEGESATFSFSLPSGSYATTVLEQMLQPETAADAK